jgi:hypothetical protein
MTINDGAGALVTSPAPEKIATSAGIDERRSSTAASHPQDDVAIVLSAAAAGALRKHASALRQRAREGLSVTESHSRPVTVRSPEAASALRWARCFDEIAADLVARPPT